MVIMFLVAVDVCLRYLFNSPLEGAYEAVELMMAIMFCYGIAYTQRQKGHVAVNLVVSRLRDRNRAIVSSIVSFISLVLFALFTWQSFLKGVGSLRTGETTFGGVLSLGQVAQYPFVFMTSAACLTLCLELLVDFFVSLKRAIRK
jgi:TRAP-type C4-dicarboxylate transport system permease small subunit